MKKLLPGEWFSSMLKVHVVFNGFNMIFVAKGKWRIQSDYCVKINCFIEDKIPIQRTQKNIDSLNEDIAPENTAYCYVQRPDQTGNSFPQHDTCVFPEFQNEYEGQGMWQVVSGVKGKTQEISFQVNVQTIGKQSNRLNSNQTEKYNEKPRWKIYEQILNSGIAVEQLLTFVERNASPSTLNMKCKLVNSKKTQKFCRFLRLSDDVGFNLEEGRGDERIRYYGNGFSELGKT